jgi:hypothetical protein
MCNPNIYYLPGRGGSIASGLGEWLSANTASVAGRSLETDLKGLDFNEQVDLIERDMLRGPTAVVASSYGAYLFMHALSRVTEFRGHIYLISPILGPAIGEGHYFRPPQSKYLETLIEQNKFPRKLFIASLVGSKDWQSQPERVCNTMDALNGTARVIEGAGHRLPHAEVQHFLRPLTLI